MRREAILALALPFCLPGLSRGDEPVCPRVKFLGTEKPDLTEAETKLICGNPDSDGWKEVPLSQAEYFLRAFLQQRAYHHPQFFPKDGVLEVAAGHRTKISGIEASGLPESLRISRRRGVIGSWLTPASLDQLKSWIVKELQNRGHGCPSVRMAADADTGLVRAFVEPGPVHPVGDVEEAATGEVDAGVFRRYEGFDRRRPLDLRLLNLSASRVVRDDLFLSAFYDLSCSTAGLKVVQRVVTAPPRLFTAGVGLDSEDLARVRVRWRNSRIGWRASTFEAVIFASQRVQSGEAELRWYAAPSSRWFLEPRAEARRDNELSFETVTSDVGLSPGLTWDNQSARVTARAGPVFSYIKTLRGQGRPDEAFASVQGRVEAMSHLYEYHLGDPQRGWITSLDATLRHRGMYSETTAHRLRLTAQSLWNLGNYDPPLLVLGWRGFAGATLTDADQEPIGGLPASQRFFLGGDVDLRGFERKELPLSGEGYLTAAYQGVELRLVEMLPYKIQPLVFVDAAMGGRRRLELEPQIYWAPGTGMRWASPVGAMRFTFARSYTFRRDPTVFEHEPHWQFFFSWGQEF